MVFGVVTSNGSVMKSGLRIGTKEYLDILKNSLLPWMEQRFGLDNVVLMQDSAPCHGSKSNTSLPWGEGFIILHGPNIGPNNSSHLNCLNYLWSVLRARTTASPHLRVNSLKTCTMHVTCNQNSRGCSSCKKLHSCVETVIVQKCGHIERCFCCNKYFIKIIFVYYNRFYACIIV